MKDGRTLILASASPRRRELLGQMGLEFEDIRDQGKHDWEYCNRHIEKFLNWIPLSGTFEMEAQ